MTKATYKQIEFDGRHNSDGGTAPDVQSFSQQKELLKRICQNTNEMRRDAIERELLARGVGYHVLKDGTLVIPAKKHDRKDIVAVCAHYDVVPGSKGYNDNGMSIVIVLEMLQVLPDNVEVVFTNGEESGQTGAREYLKYVNHSLRACVNLDVCGCFDAVYLDPMDCKQAKRLPGCKKGVMPPSDALAFYNEGIPSVCFSTGRSDVGFQEGIRQICQTIHRRAMDNDFSMLNFEMIPKVQGKVLELIGRINQNK
ncbi:MAG: M28 family peptidase [Victivallales bacterium]|nr:M28 family peptidase [Victivallales bacterium]